MRRWRTPYRPLRSGLDFRGEPGQVLHLFEGTHAERGESLCGAERDSRAEVVQAHVTGRHYTKCAECKRLNRRKP